MKYTVVIQWSEGDRCFVVFLPEFEDVMQPVTHGDSYNSKLRGACAFRYGFLYNMKLIVILIIGTFRSNYDGSICTYY